MFRYCNTLALIDCLSDEKVELVKNFKELVPVLIDEIRNKTDAVRKRSAVTMAKLAKDKEMLAYIKSLHGMDLLMSLQNQILK